jgi:hypothetical protein
MTDDLQGLMPGGSRKHLETREVQLVSHQAENRRIVIHDQNTLECRRLNHETLEIHERRSETSITPVE